MLLIGHWLGDFAAQPVAMAVKKGGDWEVCTIHCLIYTFFVCLVTCFNPYWALFVFTSHLIIDRWSLADVWLKAIKGRSLSEFLLSEHADIPETLATHQKLNYLILRGAFAAKVYLIIDAGLHLIPMYFVWQWFVA